jgi:hypothetical protein
LDIFDVLQIFPSQNVCRHLKKVENHCPNEPLCKYRTFFKILFFVLSQRNSIGAKDEGIKVEKSIGKIRKEKYRILFKIFQIFFIHQRKQRNFSATVKMQNKFHL